MRSWLPRKKTRDIHNKSGATRFKGPSHSGIFHDNTGQAYIINSETNQANLLAAASEPTNSGDLVLAALTTSSVPDKWYSGLLPADQFKYQALFMGDPATSIDWYERRMIWSEALMATPMPLNSNSHTKLSINAGPSSWIQVPPFTSPLKPLTSLTSSQSHLSQSKELAALLSIPQA